MDNSFISLGLRPNLAEALLKEKIEKPTEIQSLVIGEAISGKDLIVQSETGTGKTLAYLLPLFEKIDPNLKEMKAIILVSTHELAIQVQRQAEQLALNSGIAIGCTPIIGKVNIERQIEKLKQKPQIIVGSAGRILELIKKKKITAHTIKHIIIDEADRLLDDNNINDTLAVLKTTLKGLQIMIFSATMTKKTIDVATKIMSNPQIIKSTAKPAVPQTIEHCCFICEERDKSEVLRKLIGIMKPRKAIIFINNNLQIEDVDKRLNFHGVKTECIHGTNSKGARKDTMDGFRNGKITVLISSDLAARGLQINDVSHVFNVTIPERSSDYLHRVGRTGRNGKTGKAISIVTGKEMELMKMFEKELHIKIVLKEMFKGEIKDVFKK